MKIMFSPDIKGYHWVTNDIKGFGKLTTIRLWPFFLIWWH